VPGPRRASVAYPPLRWGFRLDAAEAEEELGEACSPHPCASMGKAMSTRLPLSFNRARVLEGIALIVFASLVIAFVHSVVPYLVD
jgi:hypothetical protein